jgi:predicted transcriptional regulator
MVALYGMSEADAKMFHRLITEKPTKQVTEQGKPEALKRKSGRDDL